MAFRFRRSIRLAPGLRLNVGKRGVSVSAGVRGASISVGRRGVYGNVGVPGTGLSLRERIDRPSKHSSADSEAPDHHNIGLWGENRLLGRRDQVHVRAAGTGVPIRQLELGDLVAL
jgi:hypothetical protein